MAQIIKKINGNLYSFDLKEIKSYKEYAKQDLSDLLNEVEEAIIDFIEMFGEPTHEQVESLALQRLPQGVVDRLQLDLMADEDGKIVAEGTILTIEEGEEEACFDFMIERLIKLSEEQDE